MFKRSGEAFRGETMLDTLHDLKLRDSCTQPLQRSGTHAC